MVRSLSYGFLSVILVIYLKQIEFSDSEIGAVLSCTIISGIIFTFLGGIYTEKVGRKNLLSIYSILFTLAGLIFFLTDNKLLIVFSTLIGMISITGADTSAFLSIESVILSKTILIGNKKNRIFGIYNMVGNFSMAAGILLIPLSSYIVNSFPLVGILSSFKLLFLFYTVLGLLVLFFYRSLGKSIEFYDKNKELRIKDNLIKKDSSSKKVISTSKKNRLLSTLFRIEDINGISKESQKKIIILSTLFSIDAFAGGFIIQTIVANWFYSRFDFNPSLLSILFFFSGLLIGLSFLTASKLADRFGLINTMVFTHIPASILIIIISFVSDPLFAVFLFLSRSFLSQMDVPSRQLFVISSVEENEAILASSITNMSRNIALSISPALIGFIIPFSSFVFLPFIIGGVLKVVYDFLLFYSFRDKKFSRLT